MLAVKLTSDLPLKSYIAVFKVIILNHITVSPRYLLVVSEMIRNNHCDPLNHLDQSLEKSSIVSAHMKRKEES